MPGLCSAVTVGFALVRRNGHEMRYQCARVGSARRLYIEQGASLTVYRRHPTLCAVMAPNRCFRCD